ncbi:MAG: DUF302 domain-containing protein [Candidatus Carbobacillus sp.]|nr:DUF302 domain-containing protein [Candidatus Carbobacillus sp.]
MSEFHYTMQTSKSVDETLQALEHALKEKRFGILWQMDIPHTLQQKGVSYDGGAYRVLEVCNPHEASQALETNLHAGYFLPCKIVVYERDGQTHVGLPRPTVLMHLVNDASLMALAERVEQALTEAIHRALS